MSGRHGYLGALLIAAALACACGSEPATPEEDAAEAPEVPEPSAPTPGGPASPAPPVAPPTEAAAQNDIGTDRPAVVDLTLAGNRDYNGSYHASGLARVCGNPLLAMMGKEHGFVFEFPTEGDHEIVDVAFGAEELAAGTTTSTYRISVGVKAKAGGRPPSFVVRPPEFGERGTATRTEENGTTRLVVEGVNDRGWTLRMKVECGPRPK